jgi:hypothetical protein
MNIRILGLLAVLHSATLVAMAHPVAQGAMEIVVRADSIDIRARVSSEEAFVAEAFGGKANARTTLDDVWRRHGQYLLAHVHLIADGVPLAGQVAGIAPPGKTTREDRITYDLKFNFPKDRRLPGAIVLRQDVLNEFIFAPGNRWEASYIVRISEQDQPVAEGLLFTSGQPLRFTCNGNVASAQPAPGLNQRAMAMAFVHHGIQHILGGYDHLLFVAGLVLAVASIWDLVKVVTAFTLAHTLTLTLAVLDLVRLSNRIVEPIIAASIVFVAAQNLFSPSRSRGWMRLAVAFGFGLFHGLGFAGGLLSAMEGMAGVAIITAIGGFSLGVEIGHQLVALPLFGVLKITRVYRSRAVNPEWIPCWALRVGSSAICAAGLVYLVAALR